jgi:hypothetical protein
MSDLLIIVLVLVYVPNWWIFGYVVLALIEEVL